jgi:hypothetical protein
MLRNKVHFSDVSHMKKIIFFTLQFLIFIYSTHLWAYMESSGFYELSNYSSASQSSNPPEQESTPETQQTTSEAVSNASTLESSPRPKERPAPQPRLSTSSAPKPAVQPQAEKPATPPAPANYSLTPTDTNGNHAEPLAKLKSCAPIKMILGKKSSRNNKCEDVTIAMSFAPVLMKNLPLCIAEAAKAKGIQRPIKQTNVYNANSYTRRRSASGQWSLHSTGRAFDIYQIDVQFADGTWLRTPMTIASKKDKFYKSFNACWERITKASNRCGFDGLIDCNDNKAHHDHVHLSMPYCPKKSGYSSI